MPDTKTIFTLLLSLVWLGTGHLLNKRWIKGLLLSVLHGFVLFLGLPALLHALRLLITLGETPPGHDHSIFLLIQGLTACLALLLLAAAYLGFIVDAVLISAGKSRKGTKNHP